MLTLSAVLALAAVALGAHLALRATRGRPAPLRLGLAHAALGIAVVVTLAWAAFAGQTTKLANAALLLFAFALVGGLFVLIFRAQREPPPLFMVYLHGASALLATTLLALALLGRL